MRGSRDRNIWRTFGLAFAIVMTPALMQTRSDCTVAGETRLEVFRVVVGGEDMIAFDPEQRVYEVMLPAEPETIWVRACAVDKAADVMYRVSDICEPHPPLTILVPEMGMEGYTVLLTQPKLCE